MSTDAAVAKDLIQTLEDGKNGFAKGAERLDTTKSGDIAATFRRYSEQRQKFEDEIKQLGEEYGDPVDANGSVAAAVHRGWLTVKDAFTDADAKGVLDVAEQGESHAVKEYQKALDSDLSADFRSVVERQFAEVKAAYDEIRSLQQSHS